MTLKIEAHVPMEIYRKFYGLNHDDALKAGVYSYGPSSKGTPFSFAGNIVDDFEDNHKLVGFLNVSSASGLTFEIENGADEVAVLELEASVMKDELGYFYHEAIAAEMDTDISNQWMTKLDADTLKLATEAAKLKTKK